MRIPKSLQISMNEFVQKYSLHSLERNSIFLWKNSFFLIKKIRQQLKICHLLSHGIINYTYHPINQYQFTLHLSLSVVTPLCIVYIYIHENKEIKAYYSSFVIDGSHEFLIYCVQNLLCASHKRNALRYQRITHIYFDHGILYFHIYQFVASTVFSLNTVKIEYSSVYFV